MANLKHGESRTLLHNTWCMMRHRCYNPKSTGWRNYGARGIGIVPEWLDYSTFRNWALANGYKDGLSLDRIDTNGFYEPSNCQFISRSANSAKPKSNWGGKPLPYLGK